MKGKKINIGITSYIYYYYMDKFNVIKSIIWDKFNMIKYSRYVFEFMSNGKFKHN